MEPGRQLTRRRFLRQAAAAGAAAPLIAGARVFGANERITMGCIGVGGRGQSDMNDFLRFDDIQVVAVCDVVEENRLNAKRRVDKRYGNEDCAAYNDFRRIIERDDIDTVLVATPDHWHAVIAVAAMQNGKDVFCEKPETLTIREGRLMTEAARRHNRILSGGSQRVWEDYNWFHRMVRGGAIGRVQEVWVNVGGPSDACFLPPEPVPAGLDWDLWLGPAPWAPFNKGRLNFRPWRDYSGGGMTDWGCHGFGGALFACELHPTGPVEIIPPDGQDHPRLTYVFANGVRIYHGGGWGGILSFKGSDGEIPARGEEERERPKPPDIEIPNYRGQGGITGDFLHCVKTREIPFRDIEVAHRTATHSHLGNLAYWLNRPLKWNPEAERFVNDPDANRWLDREKREPWGLA